MCMCGKPTINGEYGYCWNDRNRISTYPVSPPDMEEGDALIFDEPGRCGGLDSHSHHFRLVKGRYFGYALLVRHGGGDERIGLGVAFDLTARSLSALDSNARYWLFLSIHHVHREAENRATTSCNRKWHVAAAEKRIKTRKVRAGVKVWIEPANASSLQKDVSRALARTVTPAL